MLLLLLTQQVVVVVVLFELLAALHIGCPCALAAASAALAALAAASADCFPASCQLPADTSLLFYLALERHQNTWVNPQGCLVAQCRWPATFAQPAVGQR